MQLCILRRLCLECIERREQAAMQTWNSLLRVYYRMQPWQRFTLELVEEPLLVRLDQPEVPQLGPNRMSRPTCWPARASDRVLAARQ